MGTLTTDGKCLILGRRTTAIAEELHARTAAIERPRRGRLEITIDFANGSLTVAVREVSEARRIE